MKPWEIQLADLFLLFIYVEIIGMVGAFYSTNRIPVTLPIIIAITALCRLIIMQSKDMDALMLVGEAASNTNFIHFCLYNEPER